MWPRIEFDFLGHYHEIPTNLVAMIIIFTVGLCYFYISHKSTLGKAPRILIPPITATLALIGARLFHVIWERPDFYMENPSLILTKFDGLTFYGSLILAPISYHLLCYFYDKKNIKNYWDSIALFIPFGYGVGRIGCFLNGCCWGKLSGVSWAVTYYDHRAVMPSLGLPVHPVQLYESILSFLTLLTLFLLKRQFPKLKGNLIFLCLIMHSLFRLLTEIFRGDSYRGVNLILGLSTSQLISILIIIISTAIVTKNVLKTKKTINNIKD